MISMIYDNYGNVDKCDNGKSYDDDDDDDDDDDYDERLKWV